MLDFLSNQMDYIDFSASLAFVCLIILSFTLALLLSRKSGGLVCIVRDLTELKLARDKIEYLTYYDVLTGLPNRALFKNRLALALAQANRDEKMLAVMYLDLDRFKLAKDTLAYSAADELLQRVAERLATCVRQRDTLARAGSDVFTLLLPEISRMEDAARVAQKITGALHSPVDINGYEIDISVSIGIAIYPDDDQDIETLLKNADIAMCQAKEEGGNRYRFYDPAMKARARERLALQSNLRYALQRREFVLYYQPQVDARTGKVSGVEALLRWQHPELGLVPPSEFISQAEDIGFIVPVGEWVLETACARNKAWQEAGLSPVSVSVNLSARQFQQSNLAETVARVLKDTGLSPGWLTLEITEDVLMRDTELTIATLHQLRGMGIRIYIDDFGTGYSALSYLKKFPVDGIKIDKSFVFDLSCSVIDRAIVTSVIVLARRLNLEVVAEGVETYSQSAFLRSQGCSKLQGYLFSKPVPADEIEQMLWQHRVVNGKTN
ncbi:MAG: EAL domain-containing protein [Bacillota bacterium]